MLFGIYVVAFNFVQTSTKKILVTYLAMKEWRIQTRRLGGGSQIGERQGGLHLLKYQRLSATIVGCHTKVVIFCQPKSGYFCWSNYAIFQGITTV